VDRFDIKWDRFIFHVDRRQPGLVPMTIRLTDSVRAWGTPAFNEVLRREVEQLNSDHLPLHQALSVGSHVLEDTLSAMVIAAAESEGAIRAKVGLFYASLLTGCACADDPTPVNENSEYCVVQLDIDKATAEATVALLAE
jgi:hypothetical protein